MRDEGTTAADTAPAPSVRVTVATSAPVAAAHAPIGQPPAGPRDEVQPRSEIEIRWRQARNPPPPVVRAVAANVAVAAIGGIILLLIDWLAARGLLPAELTNLAPLIYVVIVVISGSILTYLWVELPTGRAGERRRSGWSAVLGFFASIPIVYLALVILFEVLRPLLP